MEDFQMRIQNPVKHLRWSVWRKNLDQIIPENCWFFFFPFKFILLKKQRNVPSAKIVKSVGQSFKDIKFLIFLTCFIQCFLNACGRFPHPIRHAKRQNGLFGSSHPPTPESVRCDQTYFCYKHPTQVPLEKEQLVLDNVYTYNVVFFLPFSTCCKL